MSAKKLPNIWKKQETPSLRKTNICKICFKEIEENSFNSVFHSHPSICEKCFHSFQVIFKSTKILGYKTLILYRYNDFFKEQLYKFKGCYDVELRTVFLEYYVDYLKIKYRNYIIVPAPSYIEHDQKRGFNHVEEIYKCLNLKICKCIHKIDDMKQSDLSFYQRSRIIKHLYIDENKFLEGKKILLVDDVYTSGSTIKAMIFLIKKVKPKTIKILLLAKAGRNMDL